MTISMVTPKTGPASDETADLVDYMRDQAKDIPEKYGINAYVTGTTALNIDTADTLAAALPKYVAVVVGLALLLLMVVFRSVLVPIKAAAGFLLSIGAAMGHRRLDLPGRQPRRPVRRRPGGADRQLPADAADRDPVRAGDGLRGVPRVAHAGGLRQVGQCPRGDRDGLRPERPGRHGRRGDHDRRLRGVPARPGPRGQVDRAVARGRSARRRLHRAHDARARRDGAARTHRLEAAAPARAGRARPGHRRGAALERLQPSPARA